MIIILILLLPLWIPPITLWVITVQFREVVYALRIFHNEAIAVEGAIDQSPKKMKSLPGSGIKTEGNYQNFLPLDTRLKIYSTHNKKLAM